MKNTAVLLATLAVAFPALAQSAGSATPTVHLTITGTITNFDEFAALVVPETYVQLVPMSADGRVGITTDDKGRFAYDSNLPKLPVPKKPAFAFDLPTIAPGKYFIAAQRLKAQGMSVGHNPVFTTSAKKQFVVEVAADAKSPLAINAGDLMVWTH